MKKIIWEKWQDIFGKDENSQASKIVIPTPMGMISHKIGANCDGGLNFWVGNTDFDLDSIHINVLKNVPGVEILNVWTPYKFRICIGKAFKASKVRRDIEKALGANKQHKTFNISREDKDAIKQLRSNISKSKFWAIYVLPNGRFEYCATDNNQEFLDNYDFFLMLEQSIGGRLLSPTKDRMVY